MKTKIQLTLKKHRTNPNNKNEVAIYLSIRVDGSRTFISTGQFVNPNYWDKKHQKVKDSYPNADDINKAIKILKSKVDTHTLEKSLANETVTASALKHKFSGKGDLHNIFEFIDHFREAMAATNKRRKGTLKNYAKYAVALELFHGSKELTFEEMDVLFLERYEKALRVKGNSGNYIYANFKMLKTFFNAAIKRQVIPATLYPFRQYECPEYDQKKKPHLTIAELDAWERYANKVTDHVDKQTAIYFLLGCYCGFRISDWKQFDYAEHVQGSVVRLRAIKNDEWVTMPISKRLRRILDLVKKTPLDTPEQVVNRTLKDIAKHLGIKKKLTSHIGRHTFAVTMCADQGISSETCARLMGITIKTCVDNYYLVTNKKVEKECLEAWKKIDKIITLKIAV